MILPVEMKLFVVDTSRLVVRATKYMFSTEDEPFSLFLSLQIQKWIPE